MPEKTPSDVILEPSNAKPPESALAQSAPRVDKPSKGRVVRYHFRQGDDVMVERPAIVVEVHNADEPFPVLDLHVFAAPVDGIPAWQAKVPMRGSEGQHGVWSWPPR